MSKVRTGLVFGLAMAATIVSMDVAFFRHLFWERLFANIAVAAAFVVLYVALFSLPRLKR